MDKFRNVRRKAGVTARAIRPTIVKATPHSTRNMSGNIVLENITSILARQTQNRERPSPNKRGGLGMWPLSSKCKKPIPEKQLTGLRPDRDGSSLIRTRKPNFFR